jgi:hypothetical protein
MLQIPNRDSIVLDGHNNLFPSGEKVAELNGWPSFLNLCIATPDSTPQITATPTILP